MARGGHGRGGAGLTLVKQGGKTKSCRVRDSGHLVLTLSLLLETQVLLYTTNKGYVNLRLAQTCASSGFIPTFQGLYHNVNVTLNRKSRTQVIYINTYVSGPYFRIEKLRGWLSFLLFLTLRCALKVFLHNKFTPIIRKGLFQNILITAASLGDVTTQMSVTVRS